MDEGTDDEGAQDAGDVPSLGQETAKYLEERATTSFERQSDLEQSIWGSIPLFSGGLIAFGAVIAATLRMLPQPGWNLNAYLSSALCAAAMIAFAVASFCLWRTIVPRDFEYPTDDANLIEYAEGLTAFHAGLSTSATDVDNNVVKDLRGYTAESFGRAAKSAFDNNTKRLTWRWRLINSLFYGFLIAFVCDATIYMLPGFFTVPLEADRHPMATQSKQPPSRRPERPAPPPMRLIRDGGWLKAGVVEEKLKS